MTAEELQRIRQYAAKIQAAGGTLSALTYEESQDLERLLLKWMDENWPDHHPDRQPMLGGS